MTDRQKFALENPCYFAFETANRRFGSLLEGGTHSVVLSLNAGWE